MLPIVSHIRYGLAKSKAGQKIAMLETEHNYAMKYLDEMKIALNKDFANQLHDPKVQEQFNIIAQETLNEQFNKIGRELNVTKDVSDKNVTMLVSSALSLVAGALMLGLGGSITGSGNSIERKKREQMEASGEWMRNSVIINKKPISYSEIPYISAIMAVAGEISENFKYGKGNPDDPEFVNKIVGGLGSITKVLTSQSIVSGGLEVLSGVANQDTNLFKRWLASATMIAPTSWNFTKFVNDAFDDRSRVRKSFVDYFRYENRVINNFLFGDFSQPDRRNAFGELQENPTYANLHGASGGLGTAVWMSGVDVGFAKIKDRRLLEIGRKLLDVDEKFQTSDGKIKHPKHDRDLNKKEKEVFLISRGKMYAKLIKENERLITSYAKKIKNGKDEYRDDLKKLLNKLHQQANEYGKSKLKG
jgi:hypothetical protein